MTDELKKPGKLDKLERIPVAMVKFSERDALELPGLGGVSSLSAVSERAPGRKCYVVDFFPAIRHFRFVCWDHSAEEPEVRMVPEGHVRLWQPL